MDNSLENCYIGSFRTFASRTFYVFDFLSFAQRIRIALNVVSVNKKIFAALVWRNKAEALLGVEKFNFTFRSCQDVSSQFVYEGYYTPSRFLTTRHFSFSSYKVFKMRGENRGFASLF